METRFDNSLCRVQVRTDGGRAAASTAARLVRQAVLDASEGMRTVIMTLDVSSPACGAVLAQLRGLAVDSVGTVRVRRAGDTVLVDVDLAQVLGLPADDGVPSPMFPLSGRR